jgi:hypothetical protein
MRSLFFGPQPKAYLVPHTAVRAVLEGHRDRLEACLRVSLSHTALEEETHHMPVVNHLDSVALVRQ